MVARGAGDSSSLPSHSLRPIAASCDSSVRVGELREDPAERADGRDYRPIQPSGRQRQVEQTLSAGSDAWMVAQGTTSGHADPQLRRLTQGPSALPEQANYRLQRKIHRAKVHP